MRSAVWRVGAVACAVWMLSGCSKTPQPYRKVVVPVKGRVTVDGRPPSSPVKIDCHNTGKLDNEHPTVTGCVTGENGVFALSTYVTGDGVPVGDYALTYVWGDFNLISMSYGGKDKLNKRYSKPDDSITKFNAKEGAAIDLGEIALTTK